jgi:hypothetical protein
MQFLWFKPKSEWEYGKCRGMVARRHRKRGNVQFVLWKAGQYEHKVDYWHDFDRSWWPQFTPEDPQRD